MRVFALVGVCLVVFIVLGKLVLHL